MCNRLQPRQDKCNWLPKRCNRLQRVPGAYKFKFQNSRNYNLVSLAKPLFPNFLSAITYSFLIQITSHKAQNSSFFHPLSFQLIEILNKSLKWWNSQRSARVLRVEANGTPRLRILQFLPPFPPPHCSHRKNNVHGTLTSSPLVLSLTLSS